MCAAIALLVLPPAATLLPVMPRLTIDLLGPQWGLASEMAPWLLVASAIGTLRTALAMALEATATFGAVYRSQLVLLASMLLSALAVALSRQWLALALGVVVAQVLAHGAQAVSAARSDLIEPRVLSKWYLVALTASFAGFLLAAASQWALHSVYSFVLVAAVISIYLSILWMRRSSIEPLRILGPS